VRGAALWAAVLLSAWTLVAAVATTRASAADPEKLSVAYCVDCVPFHFRDDDGEPSGLIIDYWRLWSEKTGIKLEFIAAPWDETLQMVGSGAADVHAGLFFNDERDKFLDYATALRKTDTHVFFHRSVPATANFRELGAYRIGVLSGDYVENFLKERVPGGVIVGYPDYGSIIAALKAGELKVFAADTPSGLYHLKRSGIVGDFIFLGDSPLYRNDWFAAAPEGAAATVDLINRGMSQISDEERRGIARRWIGDTRDAAKDDSLIIGIDRAYPPFTFLNSQGNPAGLFVDLWRAWSKKTGRKVRFRPSGWSESLESLKAGEVDIHSGLSYSAARAEWIGFSRQIYRTASRIYHRADEVLPANLDDFASRSLGVLEDSFQAAEVGRMHPDLSIKTFATSSAVLEALIGGHIEAFLQEDQTIELLLRERGLRGLVVSRPELRFVSTIHAGVLKENTKLAADINAGFELLTARQLADIEARWISDTAQRFFGRGQNDADIGLTAAEREWLNAHPVIRLGIDRAWPPYEFIDPQGVYSGLGAAFVRRIGEILSTAAQTPQSMSWADVIEGAKAKTLDVLPAVAPTPAREGFLTFTKPYMVWPNVIAARRDARGIDGIEDLAGRRVGVVKGYAIQETLARENADIDLVPMADIGAGLRALSAGEIEAFIDSPVTIRYFANQLKLADIALVAETPHRLQIAFGVRKDWPELVAIIDKALARIPPAERARLAEQAGLPTDLALTRLKEADRALLSMQELTVLVIGGLVVLVAVLALVWLIRQQRRPFFQSLRGKSAVFITAVFVVVGGATLWTLGFVGDRISGRLGVFISERHVLWHKEKVLGAVARELALARQMAESELLIQWAASEEDAATAVRAREELQRYHDNFKSKTVFLGLKKSGHFFYADGNQPEVALKVVDTLSPKDADDSWFYATMNADAAYNFNVDHNDKLGVTNLWVNYALRDDRGTHGVVGTGIGLTEFITAFVASETAGVSTMMVDAKGAIRAHAELAKIARNVIADDAEQKVPQVWALMSSAADRDRLTEALAHLKSGGKAAETLFLTIEGKQRLVAVAYLAPLGWYTMAMFDPGSLVGLQELGALAMVLGAALLVTLFIFMFGQNVLIIRPLAKLTDGTRRVSGGDYDIRLAVEQRDEIGDLTQTFNDMSATIFDYTRNLQGMVDERTNELSAAYETISSSIDYASSIQRSILPHSDAFSAIFSDYFVIWEPRDRVGGDVYWNRIWGDGVLVVLADCTGHGVPGAFMTLISTGALDRALDDVVPGQVGNMVQRVHQLVQLGLRQNEDVEGGSDDGLELGAVYLDADLANITFAGARFSVFISDGAEVREVKGTKAGLGYRAFPFDQAYAEQHFPVEDGCAYYMASDGYTDQVGGKRSLMFGKKRLKTLLKKIHSLPMTEQDARLRQAFEDYQGENVRRDDVSVIGFKV